MAWARTWGRVLLAAGLVLCGACSGNPREHAYASSNIPFPDRSLIRAIGATRVWVVLNGRRHAVQDKRMLEALGLKYDDIMNVPLARVDALAESFPFRTDYAVNRLLPQSISKMPNRTLVKAADDARVYIIAVG